MNLSSTTLVLWIIALLIVLTVLYLVQKSRRIAREVEVLLPSEGRMMKVPGAHLHVVQKGSGPPLVLIHGLGGQTRNFTHSLTELLANDFTVYAIDRPGCGYSFFLDSNGNPSNTHHSGSRLQAQTDVIAAFIALARLKQPVVVGHSLGGAIALDLAARYPDRVKTLALVAPLTHMPSKVSQAFAALMIRSHWLRQCFAWTMYQPLARKHGAATNAAIFSPEAAPADFDTRGGGMLGLRPAQFLAASADLEAAQDLVQKLLLSYATLNTPTSVLFGTEDAILNWQENGEALQKAVPHVRLELIEGAGHMLPITQAARTAQFIRESAQITEPSTVQMD